MNIYEVAVAAPLRQTLTYKEPAEGAPELPVGVRVSVPLGRRYVTGYILERQVLTPENSPSFELKSVVEQLDSRPIFPAQLIPLYRWLADYYHYPLGEVIRTALPGDTKVSGGYRIRLTAEGGRELADRLAEIDEPLAVGIKRLLANGELPPAVVTTLWRNPGHRRLLEKWRENNWLSLEQEVICKQIKRKTETRVLLNCSCFDPAALQITASGEQAVAYFTNRFPELKKSEVKTLTVFFDLCRQQENTSVGRPELTRHYSGAGKSLATLCAKGILQTEEHVTSRDPFGDNFPYFARPVHLTPDQTRVIASLQEAISAEIFRPILLHGVTGCGKTEVYLGAAEAALQQGKTVLVMVPEIALSTQLEAHFFSRFGEHLAILHSGLTAGQRHEQWQRILSGEAGVVIGARSAVFAPLAQPGLIIVDEEHEPAYKQDDGLRYNGRDLAVLRAKFASCPVILGSATPSVTSYHHATTGKYELLSMPQRVHGKPLPEVEVVDLTKERKFGQDRFFSEILIAALAENLQQGRQSLLFLNRRGFSGFMLCRDCGHIIRCRHCQVSLTLHKARNQLVCHYCGFTLRSDIVCPSCRSASLIGLGLGSERLEEEVKNLFPAARVARLDSDTANDRKHYLYILKALREGEIDILIGTQMIAKGLDFPNVTLVGVVWADSGLGIPDFKASERTFQLLAQVTGRAGRGDYAGRVIIQTTQPNHYAIVFARDHAYCQLFTQELKLRRDLGYPPFSRLVNVRLSGRNEQRLIKTAMNVSNYLRQISVGRLRVDILGPAPAPLALIKDNYRWHILLKSDQPTLLHELCDQLLQHQPELCKGGVALALDVDPENMM